MTRPATIRHGPAVMAAIQGHVTRLDAPDVLEDLDERDWTASGLQRRQRHHLLSRADRLLLWAAVLLALLALAGMAGPSACTPDPPPVTPAAHRPTRGATP